MATWHIDAKWTPALASELAQLLDESGGNCAPVNKLRAAIAAKSGILGQRCQQAYETALPLVRDNLIEHDYREFMAVVTDILARSMGLDPPERGDWIQDAVIARAAALGMTAYAIAQASNGAVSDDHVQAYLTRRKSMGSHKLQHVLSALGLTVTPRG